MVGCCSSLTDGVNCAFSPWFITVNTVGRAVYNGRVLEITRLQCRRSFLADLRVATGGHSVGDLVLLHAVERRADIFTYAAAFAFVAGLLAVALQRIAWGCLGYIGLLFCASTNSKCAVLPSKSRTSSL
jgi:hypothetical protein